MSVRKWLVVVAVGAFGLGMLVLPASANGASENPSAERFECPDGPSNADFTGNGANTHGAYDNTCEPEHEPGNGNDQAPATGQPCAGCVGAADNKNPPGQFPNGSDANRGYECDENQGVGKENPAHTGCQTTTKTPPTTVTPTTVTPTTVATRVTPTTVTPTTVTPTTVATGVTPTTVTPTTTPFQPSSPPAGSTPPVVLGEQLTAPVPPPATAPAAVAPTAAPTAVPRVENVQLARTGTPMWMLTSSALLALVMGSAILRLGRTEG